ncbi:threonine synthase [Tepidibacter hydrothermalis]|uniref:Pyridoxal-phosphate dependent enzyme n=1 Tax=Tepidibacter hydrothermalis TaxID=3036126 RepID=A0ABY8EF89_9FIRM|nr:pyridoxal-phosphate dependent enzyme [Tepidibacter hydrothermalis]WFD11597.1 pyridoxal-phosphate dependent enzyme [Tepidibacter hydrothermalis]
MKYVCKKCENIYAPNPEVIKCECGGALWLDYEGKLKKSDIHQNDFTMWRYSAAYPVKREDVKISFGEGLTPFSTIDYKEYEIIVKQDNLMPTGSFKDRGVAMVTNYLNNLGVTKFTEDSSGNGGSAFAGYCALGRIDCKIFVPAGTSEGKIAQMKVYGANLVEVEGTRAHVASEAMKSIDGSIYVGHNWHPFFVHGVKSVAYEMWEQNGFKAPDNVICVAGNGSMIIGVYLGFKELLDSDEIDRMPKIYGIQADNYNTLYREFVGDDIEFKPLPTIAEGISIYKSTKHEEVVEFVKKTKGKFISVTEDEIKNALLEIGEKGFYIEPTSAAAFAGLNRLIDEKIIDKSEQTAIIISGNGLKATDKIMKLL